MSDKLRVDNVDRLLLFDGSGIVRATEQTDRQGFE